MSEQANRQVPFPRITEPSQDAVGELAIGERAYAVTMASVQAAKLPGQAAQALGALGVSFAGQRLGKSLSPSPSLHGGAKSGS